MNELLIAVNAVFPFLSYLLLGGAAKKAGVVDDDFLQKLNTLSFRVFFPFLVFSNIYRVDITGLGRGIYIGLCMGISLAILIGSWIVVPKLVKDRSRAVVIIQALYRGNAVLFSIPLATSLFGDAGAQAASLLAGVMVPFFNMLAVILLESFRGGKVSVRDLIRKLFANPLIAAALLGLALAVSPWTLPQIFRGPVSTIASMGVPLSMFALGGRMKISSYRKNARVLILVSILRLVLFPALFLPLLLLLNLSVEEWFSIFLVLSVSVASSSFAMAANMGGDGELAGELVAATTMFSLPALFLWLVFLQSAHILVL